MYIDGKRLSVTKYSFQVHFQYVYFDILVPHLMPVIQVIRKSYFMVRMWPTAITLNYHVKIKTLAYVELET